MKKIPGIYLIIVVVLLLSGCVYYNTFYNARKNFELAQERPLNSHGRPSAQAIKEYNAVVKKCGKIITNYKNSKWTDDAAFLMARALFYKKTNPHKALKQFNELINNFPDSEFTPEARLYVMRLFRRMHKDEDLNKYVTDFLIAPENSEWYNRAHLLIAEFSLEDDEYTKATYHLQKILDNGKKSDEYEEAYFLLGKTYHQAKDYDRSIEVLSSLLRLRLQNEMKLDARFYLAYSYYYQDDLVKAQKIVKKLLKKESRNDRIPYVKMLRGRIKLANGDADGFVDDMKFILDNHSRTAISAECAFLLGEYYLYTSFDYAEAIVYYNKVKTEYKKSEFVEAAITKSSVASQIQLLSDPDRNLNPESLVDEQFKLAEYFINVMSMPDSALVVYDNIIETKEALALHLDTLRIELAHENDKFIAYQDSIKLTQVDSISTDTTKVEVPKFENSPEYRTINNQIENYESTLADFEAKILPFTYFVKSWIYLEIKSDSTNALLNYDVLKNNYATNEYTYACSLMLNGEKAVLESPLQQKNLQKYDLAVENMYNNPDSSIKLLAEFANDPLSKFYLNSLYTSGFVYKFVLDDSVSAKPFFDKLLDEDFDDKYRVNVRTFYQEGTFVKTEVKDDIDSLNVQEEVIHDTLDIEQEEPIEEVELKELKPQKKSEIVEELTE